MPKPLTGDLPSRVAYQARLHDQRTPSIYKTDPRFALPQASKYLLDPLNAPEPSEETGPGTHFSSPFSSNNPYPSPPTSENQKKTPSAHNRQTSGSGGEYPSPPDSAPASPHYEHSTRRRELSGLEGSTSQRQSIDSTQVPTSTNGRARTSSLSSRYPGDNSHRPLDVIKRETKLANRAPHLRKKHMVGPDTIDKLDWTSGAYHHDGPYDATLLARNISSKSSPLQAVAVSNREALKATPREKIIDSIRKHRPLDGVAIVPPGIPDRHGRVYHYEEGANLMIEDGGNYKRWPGVVRPNSTLSPSLRTCLTSIPADVPSGRCQRQRRAILHHRKSPQRAQRSSASHLRRRIWHRDDAAAAESYCRRRYTCW